MAAPRPSSPNNTSTPTRGSLDYSSYPRTPSPLNPSSQSPPPTSLSNSLLPTRPPLAGSTRLYSFSGRDPSPVRNALIPISRATSAPASPASQSSFPAAVSSSPPAPSIAFGSSSSTTSSLFRSRSPSHLLSPQTSSESEESTATLASTWWSLKPHPPRPWAEHSKRKRTVPPEQAEAYVHTRSVRHLSNFFFVPNSHLHHPCSDSEP